MRRMQNAHPSHTSQVRPEKDSPAVRQERHWALLACVVAMLLAFWPWWSAPFDLPFSRSGDLLRHYLPFKQSLYQLLELRRDAGQSGFPTWNPYTLGGHPMSADPGYGYFYPPGWLFYGLPPAHAFSLFFGLHALLGLGLSLGLARCLGLSWGASALMALAYALNLKLIGTYYAGFATMIPAQSWLPGAFWGLMVWMTPSHPPPSQMLRRGLGVLLTGVSLGAQVLAGDAQLMLYTALGLGLFALLGLPHLLPKLSPQPLSSQTPTPPTSRRIRLEALFGLGLAGLLALGLAWPLLPKAAQLTEASVRAGGIPMGVAMQMSNHPAHLLAMVLPSLSGRDIDLTWRGPDSFWETSFGPGLVVWSLALLSLLRHRQDKRVLPLWGLSWLMLVLSYGASGPFYPLLYFLVPGFDHFRGPARLLPLLGLLLGVLAGLELDARTRPEATAHARRPARLFAAIVAALLGAGLLWLLIHRQTLVLDLEAHARALIPVTGAGARAWEQLFQEFSLSLVLMLGLAYAFREPTSPAPASIAPASIAPTSTGSTSMMPNVLGERARLVVLSLTALPLGWQALQHLDARPVADLLPPHNLTAALSRASTSIAGPPPRILDLAGAIPDAVAVLHKLSLVNGMNPLVLSRVYTFWRFVQGEAPEVPTNQPVYGLLISQMKHPILLELLRIQSVVTSSPVALPGFRLTQTFHDVPVFHQFLGMDQYPSVQLFQREEPLPPAWQVTQGALAPDDATERLTALERLDPFRGALLETGETGGGDLSAEAWLHSRGLLATLEQLPARAERPSPMKAAEGVEIKQWLPDDVLLKVTAPASGSVLVLSEVWAPGWRATRETGASKVPLPVWRADHLLRAVPLQPGEQLIHLWYAP